MKTNRILFLIFTAFLSAALIYGFSKARSAAKPDAHAEEAHEEHETPEISGLVFEPTVSGDSWDVISAAGKVGPNANKVVKVSPRIAGKITGISANVGDVVVRGQVLATISSVELAEARAAYNQAASKVSAAQQAYEGRVKLARLGAFSGRPLEEARTEQASTQGELAQAKSELAQSKSELVRSESELAQCVSRLLRAKELYKDQIVSRQDLESAEAEFKRDSAEVDTAKSKIAQAEAKVRQLEAQSSIAKSYLDREKKIHQSDMLSSREIQQAKADLTSAKHDLSAAADAIKVLGSSPRGAGEAIAVTSPISGRVVERNVNLGEMAEPSTVMFTVMDLSDVWVEASVYEKDISRVRKGQSVQIHPNGTPDRVFSGKVAYVGDLLDPTSRTAKIRCSVANPDGALKPEMFASVDIITGKRSGAVLVKKQAVVDDGGKKIAFIACADCPEDIKAQKSVCGEYDKRELELGSTHGDMVEVVKGLDAGEQVVVEGQYQLKTALGSGKLEAGCTDH